MKKYLLVLSTLGLGLLVGCESFQAAPDLSLSGRWYYAGQQSNIANIRIDYDKIDPAKAQALLITEKEFSMQTPSVLFRSLVEVTPTTEKDLNWTYGNLNQKLVDFVYRGKNPSDSTIIYGLRAATSYSIRVEHTTKPYVVLSLQSPHTAAWYPVFVKK